MIEIRPRDLDVKTQVGDKMVSTVALTVEHFPGMWYETMIFSCDSAGEISSFCELYCDRYASRAAAEEGHERTVERLRAGELDLYNEDAPIRRQSVAGCSMCDREAAAGNTFFPSHDPSPRCQSGGYEHCTCDTCF